MTEKELISNIQISSRKRGVNITKTQAKQSAINNGFIKNGKVTSKAKGISFKPKYKSQKPAGYIHVNLGIQAINNLSKT